MKKRLISTLLASILVIGITPIAVSAEWRQGADNQWVWLDSRNIKVTGWNQINGSWYFFDGNGYMKTGWIENGGQKYYSNESGAMQIDWKQINGLWYYFNNSGAMATDTVVGGYYLGEDGVMQDIAKNKVLFENEYAKVTYIGINRNSPSGPKLKVLIENKLNQDICVQIKHEAIVDGVKNNATLNEEILPKAAIAANFVLASSTDKNFKNVKGEINVIEKNSWKVLKTEEFSIDPISN